MSPTAGAVLDTPEAIIEALGGPNKLADVFAFPTYHAVSMWRTRGTIPPVYRPKIKDLVEAAGFKVPDDFLSPPPRQ